MTEPRVPVLIDEVLLDSTTGEARRSGRRRRNFNFHHCLDAVSNRLLNAMEPGSYVQPHRHLDPVKDETFVVLRGAFGLVIFDDAGRVTLATVLSASGSVRGADVPSGTYHSLFALQPGSVFFEAKAGPYCPLADAERAPWAPPEGDPGSGAYLAWMEGLLAR
jgi:cupin fold WbuC family metalloprotein